MSEPQLQPYWLVADLARLEVNGTPLANLAGDVQDSIDKTVKPFRDEAKKAQEMQKRLSDWYADRQDELAAPVGDLTDALATFLEDAWTSGVHLFVPFPDWGGFGYLQRTLSEAMGRAADENRPMFGDGMYSGGVLVVFGGGKLQVFTAIAAMAVLFGGNPQAVMESLGDAMISSPPLADLAGAFVELSHAPQEALSSTAKSLSSWFDQSAFGKIVKDGFPASIMKERNAPPEPVTPSSVEEGSSATFTLRGKFDLDLEVKFDGAYIPPTAQSATNITMHVPARLLKAGARTFTGFTRDGAGRPGLERSLGQVTVRTKNPFDTLRNQETSPVFDQWRALTVGSAVGTAFPGAAALVGGLIEAIDTVGNLAGEAGNAVTFGLNLAGNAVVGAMDKIAGVTDDLGAAAGSLVSELTKVSISTLFIPPNKGGMHQLGWALSQGLSEFAVNAPDIDEDQIVGAVFLCAGAVTQTDAIASLKRFGAAFGISALANLP